MVIRRLLQQLKKAGIVSVTRGSGGADIGKPLDEITLFNIYNAVQCVEDGGLFHFHENPNPPCPVGKNIHFILDVRLEQIQQAMGMHSGKRKFPGRFYERRRHPVTDRPMKHAVADDSGKGALHKVLCSCVV